MDLNGNFPGAGNCGGQNPRPDFQYSERRGPALRLWWRAQLKREKLNELTKILEDQLTTAPAESRLCRKRRCKDSARAAPLLLPSDQPADRKNHGRTTRDPRFARVFFDMAVERGPVAPGPRRDRSLIGWRWWRRWGCRRRALSAIGSVQHAPELSNSLKELSVKQAQLRTYRYHYTDAYPPLLAACEKRSRSCSSGTIPTLARAPLSTQLAARESETGGDRWTLASPRSAPDFPAGRLKTSG